MDRNPFANAGDVDLIPGLGREAHTTQQRVPQLASIRESNERPSAAKNKIIKQIFKKEKIILNKGISCKRDWVQN